ncbi:hypothetical protein B0H13DRAFT_2532452 [Mycena leptocephala]|nr:hypothetical protein B0H13DRAFT_2532452 [Mycena leptocephala]
MTVIWEIQQVVHHKLTRWTRFCADTSSLDIFEEIISAGLVEILLVHVPSTLVPSPHLTAHLLRPLLAGQCVTPPACRPSPSPDHSKTAYELFCDLTGAFPLPVRKVRFHSLPIFRPLLPLRSLFVSYVFVANVVSIAEGVQLFLDAVHTIDAKRPRARLWAPTGLRSVWKLVSARVDGGDGAFGEDTSVGVVAMGDMGDLHGQSDYRKDQDSRQPTNLVQRLMNAVYNGYLWTGTAEAVFTFKCVFISVALWVAAVIPHSAHFYHVEKGNCTALIAARTTLNIYAADQIFNYVTRLTGTLVGLNTNVRLPTGNGSDSGNPYGAAAAFGVVVLPLIYLRVFAPAPYLAGNVICATFALVVGYSYTLACRLCLAGFCGFLLLFRRRLYTRTFLAWECTDLSHHFVGNIG